MNRTFPTADPAGSHAAKVAADGYAVVRGALAADRVAALREAVAGALGESALESRGVVVAARNLLDACPQVARLWQTPPLTGLLVEVLGAECGLVRALFFDKPPGRTWGLPWHRDRTIAVRQHRLRCAPFAKPTVKAGVPHVEATADVLDRMLTLRLHLDDANAENGALRVMPGSHAEPPQSPPDGFVLIEAAAGDCLAMRPLLSHSSAPSQEGSPRHRRVIHLEFAADRSLPGDYEWREFRPVVM